MGCFLGCFGGERGDERRGGRRRRRSAKRLPRTERSNQRNDTLRPSDLVPSRPRGPRQSSLTQVTPRLSPEKLPLDPAVESAFCELTFPLDQSVELSSEKMIVTPESTVLEEVSGERNSLKEPPVDATDQENSLLHTSVDTEIRTNEKKSSSLARKKVTFDLNVKTYEPVEERCYSSDDEIEEEQTDVKSQLPLSPITFPSNHRYQNCDSDDEGEELGEEEEEEEEDYYYSDSDEEEGLDELDEGIELDEIGIRIEGNDEESYESFFSLSIDRERESYNDNTNGEVSSLISKPNPISTEIIIGLNTRDRSQFVHSVLNPVENLSQWKQAKVNNLSDKPTNKDKTVNSNPNSNLYKENKSDEVLSVDTSLSTWLVSADNNNSQAGSFNREERPILGALTVADIRETSVNSSPRRSPPSRSPSRDDVPIIGTVGSYWNCNHSSRFREEKMGKCR